MAKADIDVTIKLELTEDEAIVLRDILANIAGYPDTRRALATQIAEALDAVGIEFDGDNIPHDMEGSIEFTHVEFPR